MKRQPRHCNHPLLAAVIATVATVGSAGALAATYEVTNLGTLGGIDATALGVNSSGLIVGRSSVAVGGESIHAFSWDGALVDLGASGGDPHSFAFGVNDAGQIVGVSFTLGELTRQAVRWDAGLPTVLGNFTPRDINNAGLIVGAEQANVVGLGYVARAVAWDGGVLTSLGALGGDTSAAWAVNDAGWVVGASNPANDDPPHAFVSIAGVMHDLGTLGGDTSMAYDINDMSQVVGVSRTAAGDMHAFLYQLDAAGAVTTRTDLGELGGGYSYARGVNNAGQVVGTSDDRAFVWESGAMQDLNTLIPPNTGWELIRANAINDAGQIVGEGKFEGGVTAFLLSSVEPCPADLDGDGSVGLADLGILLAHYGTPSGANPEDGDLDGDGDVDLADLGALLAVYNTVCP